MKENELADIIDEESSLLEKIQIKDIFVDLDAKFLSKLKANRAYLELIDPFDFERAFDLLTHLAMVKKFAQSQVGAVNQYFKNSGINKLESQEQYNESWIIFDSFFERSDRFKLMGMSDSEISKEMKKPSYFKPNYDIETAFGFVFKGVMNLFTHSDSTSEIVQTYESSKGMINKIVKSIGSTQDVYTVYDSKQASVLISAPFGSEYPPGVTMSQDDQLFLGVVCSPLESFITSGGWAAYGPFQHFFMIKLHVDGVCENMFSIMLKNRIDLLGKFVGYEGALDLDIMKNSLKNESKLSFISFIYFCVHYVNDGGFSDVIGPIVEKYADQYDLKSSSLICSPIGCGVNFIQLPISDNEYRVATPLLNLGLLRELHSSYFDFMKMENVEDKEIWRSLFTEVAVGGSKPQNCGTMFNSIIPGGKIKALYSNLSSQNSGLRYTKQKIRNGRSLYRVSKNHAQLISTKSAPKDISMVSKSLSAHRKIQLKNGVIAFVDVVFNYIETMMDLCKTGRISSLEIMTPTVGMEAAAERNIIQGKASVDDIDRYTVYLRNGVMKHIYLSNHERDFVSMFIREELVERLGK